MKRDVRAQKNIGKVVLVLYIAMVLFITLFARVDRLEKDIRLMPFWSYIQILSGNTGQLLGIVLNVALFIPLGFFLAQSYGRKLFPVFGALGISLLIEITQFLFCRGVFDIDDLISNGIGALIGVDFWKVEEKIGVGYRKALSIFLLVAGIIGCVMAYNQFKETPKNSYTRAFYFEITSVHRKEDKVIVEGLCRCYDRSTPKYKVFLKDGKAILSGETILSGAGFQAEFSTVSQEKKYEVTVQFRGHQPMETECYIRGECVEYVPEDICVPEEFISSNAVLKAYCAEKDSYVIQKDDRLIWLIGFEIDETTEIIYHLYTTELEKLPEYRAQYGFDNRGFRVGSANEKSWIGKYRVFEAEIPQEYNITAIMVGFNTAGTITWTHFFRV